MLTSEQSLKAIEDGQNAIAAYEHLKLMTDDEKHIGALNRLIMIGHKNLRKLEERHIREFGEPLESPPLGKLRGSDFTALLRNARNALRFS
ncbi:MAG: hypothetical protein FWG72_00745 [Oscillospiraceae bacterium]|nr:hypothetical protein [Oscillospiraceae bacterium]